MPGLSVGIDLYQMGLQSPVAQIRIGVLGSAGPRPEQVEKEEVWKGRPEGSGGGGAVLVLGFRLAMRPPNPVLFSGHTLEPASLKQMGQGTVLTVALWILGTLPHMLHPSPGVHTFPMLSHSLV